jgi:hypothetical protein
MKLFCILGFHNWNTRKIEEMKHRPCYRYHTCKTCGKEERFEGWHVFKDVGDVYYMNVTHTYGGDPIYSEIESRQKKICTDCKYMAVVVLK